MDRLSLFPDAVDELSGLRELAAHRCPVRILLPYALESRKYGAAEIEIKLHVTQPESVRPRRCYEPACAWCLHAEKLLSIVILEYPVDLCRVLAPCSAGGLRLSVNNKHFLREKHALLR